MIIRKTISDDTGQISLDYIIGICIFIVSFFFLYNILNTLFLPFQSNTDEVKPMAERVSTVLVESIEGLVVSETNPNILDKTKVQQFASELNSTYDEKLTDLGLKTSNLNYGLNVSLRYFNNSLYPNASYPLLLGGPIPDDYVNLGQTIRMVYLLDDTQNLMLVIKVWL